MNQVPTILFLHPSADRYGADMVLLQLIRGIAPGRWNPVVAVPEDGPLVPLLEEAGAKVVFGPLGVGSRATLSSPVKFTRFMLGLRRVLQICSWRVWQRRQRWMKSARG